MTDVKQSYEVRSSDAPPSYDEIQRSAFPNSSSTSSSRMPARIYATASTSSSQSNNFKPIVIPRKCSKSVRDIQELLDSTLSILRLAHKLHRNKQLPARSFFLPVCAGLQSHPSPTFHHSPRISPLHRQPKRRIHRHPRVPNRKFDW